MRSRKQQAKNRHIKFHDRLKDFRDWLTHLGPIPAEGWTVHRMDNYRGYEPGNIKWATKEEQTQIRKTTKWYEVDGKPMTKMQLSKHLGLTYRCLYSRLRSGWSVERLLDEKKKHGGIKAWSFPSDAAHVLEPLYIQRKSFNQSRIDWYIVYLKKRIQEFENASILLGATDEDVVVLYLELENTTAELKQLLQIQREQAESEVTALIAALSGSKKFPHLPYFGASTPPSAVTAPTVASPVADPEPDTQAKESAEPVGAEFGETAPAQEQTESESLIRWGNISFLVQLVGTHWPENKQFSANPYNKGDVIPDDRYQEFADAGCIAAVAYGKQNILEHIHECDSRGIPSPSPKLLPKVP